MSNLKNMIDPDHWQPQLWLAPQPPVDPASPVLPEYSQYDLAALSAYARLVCGDKQ